jgi:hypothetical protein
MRDAEITMERFIVISFPEGWPDVNTPDLQPTSRRILVDPDPALPLETLSL